MNDMILVSFNNICTYVIVFKLLQEQITLIQNDGTKNTRQRRGWMKVACLR